MAEYINRDDALLHSEIIRVYSKDYGNIDVVPVEYLADIPSADVQPVKRGRWEDCSNGWMCSCCERDSTKDTPFCPNCGARMDGDTE